MRKYISKDLLKVSVRELLMPAAVLSAIGVLFVLVYTFYLSHDNLWLLAGAFTYNSVRLGLFFAMLLGSSIIGRVAVSFAWKREKTDYLFSLPYSRGQIFCTKVLAAVAMQVAVLAAMTIAGIAASAGGLGVDTFLGDMLIQFANTSLGSVIIIGSLFLAASVTGRETSLVFVFNNIILLPLLGFIVRFAFMMFGGRMIFQSYFLQKRSLNIVANILSENMNSFDASRYLPAILFSIALAAIIIAAGYFLFQKRSGEVTGQHTAGKWVHYFAMAFMPFVFTFGLAIAIALEGELEENDVPIAVLIAIVAILLAFFYDVLVHKKLRRKNRCIWVVLACGAVSFAVVFSMIGIARMQESREIGAGDVESVNILKYGEYGYIFDSYAAYNLTYGEYLISNIDIDDGRLAEIAATGETDEELTADFEKSYRELMRLNLKSGGVKYVLTPVYFESGTYFTPMTTSMDSILYSIPEYKDSLYAIVPDKYINRIYDGTAYGIDDRQDELMEIYHVFADEFQKLTFDEKASISIVNRAGLSLSFRETADDYNLKEDAKYMPITYLYVKGRAGTVDFMNNYKLTAKTPEAANMFIEMTNEINMPKFIEHMDKYGSENVLISRHSLAFRYIDNEGKEQIRVFSFYDRNVFIEEAYNRGIDMVNRWQMETPKITDNMAMISFYDEYADSFLAVFIRLSDEQLDDLQQAYDDIMPATAG